MDTIIIRINKMMPIFKYQFGYPNVSLLSSSSSLINNNINIKNVINQNNIMMMMNASVAFIISIPM
jgi:archaeosine-15-forming tRNA-guanine transglycosylase